MINRKKVEDIRMAFEKNQASLNCMNDIFDKIKTCGADYYKQELLILTDKICEWIDFVQQTCLIEEVFSQNSEISLDKVIMNMEKIADCIETNELKELLYCEKDLYKILVSISGAVSEVYNHEYMEKVITDSIFFDEEWYKNMYADDLNGESPVSHYLKKGWKEGKNPSVYFDGTEYWRDNIGYINEEICPLFHYEEQGVLMGCKVKIHEIEKLKIVHPECFSLIDDGFLRLRITNRCNAKCRFCGQQFWTEEFQQLETPREWYFEGLKPIYEKLKMILVTGGDAYFAKESYNYLQFMSENYPAINIMTESNGIGFNEKFQKLAAENLIRTHFSINGSNAEVFEKGCWGGPNGKVAYGIMLSNIKNYIEKLKEIGHECFNPSISMVINKDNLHDVYNFIKLALSLKTFTCSFYFDYTENNMSGEYFTYPETREALRTMMEIEKVIAGKAFVNFRLWVPSKELGMMQKEIDMIPVDQLLNKYPEIVELVKDRDMNKELEERNRLRRINGKKELSLDEEFNVSLKLINVNGKDVCGAPWTALDLYPDGNIEFCSWFNGKMNIQDYMEDGKVDMEKVVNSAEFITLRNHFLHGEYMGCQACCPMNDVLSPIMTMHEHGYDVSKNKDI